MVFVPLSWAVKEEVFVVRYYKFFPVEIFLSTYSRYKNQAYFVFCLLKLFREDDDEKKIWMCAYLREECLLGFHLIPSFSSGCSLSLSLSSDAIIIHCLYKSCFFIFLHTRKHVHQSLSVNEISSVRERISLDRSTFAVTSHEVPSYLKSQVHSSHKSQKVNDRNTQSRKVLLRSYASQMKRV